MLLDPSKIVFESKEDVIDYITKGLPPTRDNFEKVMAAMNNPVHDCYTRNPGEVIIKESAVNCSEKEIITVNEICRQVYNNRRRNRNIAIGIGIGVTAAVVIGYVSANSSDDDKKKR